MDVDARIRHERVKANGLDFHVATCGEGDRLALLLHGDLYAGVVEFNYA